MTHAFARLVCAALLSGAVFGQTFEFADIHPSAPTSQPYLQAGFIHGRYEVRNATMVDLIDLAYEVQSGSVYGGPNWVALDRFDIIAKAPPNSTYADRLPMLKALLAERFKLVVHDDQQPLDVFTLTMAKRNPNLKEAEGDNQGEGVCQPPKPAPAGPYTVLDCRHMSMDSFARQFRQYAQVAHRIVDVTGLKGTYDFTIKWSARAPGNGDDSSAYIPFPEAAEKQLGLKLTAEKRPSPVIAIDSANRTPTPNDADVLAKLPQAPTEFEVAEIKPSGPDQQMRGGVRPGGRLDLQGYSLMRMIEFAWETEAFMVMGAPKWVETEGYDVMAKAATGADPPPISALRAMLRALLVERFKLVVHNEEQPLPVWTVTVGKKGVKLNEADPAERIACFTGPGQTGTGSATLPAIVYTCQNTTMAQFAENMHRVAGGYVDRPAVDMTGLKGAYDFVLTWTPKGAVGGSGPAAGDAAPTGGITFFEAVEKLGLHLESGQKHPMQVLVVDRAEKVTAADN
jgi:uncharacterized protein (TIGR03435 family)